jgi:hypothetical protein
MTRFTDAVEKVRALPEERQELAAELLFNLVSGDAFDVELDSGQIAEVEQAKAEADAGNLASEADVDALWKKHRA